MFKNNLLNNIYLYNTYKNNYKFENHMYFVKVSPLLQILDKHAKLDIEMNNLIDYFYNPLFFQTINDKNVPFKKKTIYKEIKIFFFMQILYNLSYLKEENRYLHIQYLPYWINRFESNHQDEKYISLNRTEIKEYNLLSKKHKFNDRYNNLKTINNHFIEIENSECSFFKNKNEPHITNDKYYLNLFLIHFKRFKLKEYTNIKNTNNRLNSINIAKVQKDNKIISKFFHSYTDIMSYAMEYIDNYLSNDKTNYFLFLFQLQNQFHFMNIFNLMNQENYDYSLYQMTTFFDRSICFKSKSLKYNNKKYINDISFDDGFDYFVNYVSTINKNPLSSSLNQYIINNYFSLYDVTFALDDLYFYITECIEIFLNCIQSNQIDDYIKKITDILDHLITTDDKKIIKNILSYDYESANYRIISFFMLQNILVSIKKEQEHDYTPVD